MSTSLPVPEQNDNSSSSASQQRSYQSLTPERSFDGSSQLESVEVSNRNLTTYHILTQVYLPWCFLGFIAVLLLIGSFVLLMNATRLQSETETASLPTFFASIPVLTINGQILQYSSKLSYLGNAEAILLRRQIEPLLFRLYSYAFLDVEKVVVLAFKYGKPTLANPVSSKQNKERKQSNQFKQIELLQSGDEQSVIVQHWIYIREEYYGEISELIQNLVKASFSLTNITINHNQITLFRVATRGSSVEIEEINYQMFFEDSLKVIDLNDHANREYMDWSLQGFSNYSGHCRGFTPSTGLQVTPFSCTSSKSSSYGNTCSFSCNEGYVLLGSHIRTCLTSGFWSGVSATCKARCPPVRLPFVGTVLPSFCSNTSVASGQTCIVQCPKTHVLVFSNFHLQLDKLLIFCQENGMWSEKNVFCKAKCPELDLSYNYNIKQTFCLSEALEGSTCLLKCMDGFAKDNGRNEQELTCGSNGKWNAKILKCKITTFKRKSVETSSTSKLLSVFYPSEKIEAVTFLVSTIYSEMFLCLSVDEKANVILSSNCSTNSSNNKWTIFGNYMLKNVHLGKCLKENSMLLKLLMDNCNSSDLHQVFNNPYQYKISSHSGYYLKAELYTLPSISLVPVTYMFSTSSDWRLTQVMSGSQSPLARHHLDNGCLPIPLRPNMKTTQACFSNMTIGSVCQVQCINGFAFPDGSISYEAKCVFSVWNITSNFTCLSLSFQSQHCPAYDSSLLFDVSISPSDCISKKQPIGSTCSFFCDTNSKYLHGMQTIGCMTNGRWSSIETVMCKPYCKALSPSENIVVSESASSCINGKAITGDICLFDCSKLYHLSRKKVLTCTDSGHWDENIPSCKSLCPIPESLDQNMVFDLCDLSPLHEGYAVGTNCSVSCSTGYKSSITTTYCMSFGVWENQDELECMPTCPPLEDVFDQKVFPKSCLFGLQVLGTVCTISCSKNGFYFLVNGNKLNFLKLTCDYNGLWYGNFATCSKLCPPLKNFANNGLAVFKPIHCAHIFQVPGQTCVLSCLRSGSVHNGVTEKKCDSEGNWQPINQNFGNCLPSCIGVKSPLHGTVVPSYCTNMFVPLGTECIFECPNYMDRQGPEKIRCISTLFHRGTWSDLKVTTCNANCPPISSITNINFFPKTCTYRNFKEGASCFYSCKTNAVLESNYPTKSLQCLKSGLWSAALLQCSSKCLNIQISNGRLYCSDLKSASLSYLPETQCILKCDFGFTPLFHYKITCDENGNWFPDPSCRKVYNGGFIFQKLSNSIKCLIARWADTSTSYDWTLGFVNSSKHCIQSQKSAIWLWYGLSNLKHSDTGLCVTAEMNKVNSMVVLSPCNKLHPLQHWTCDTSFPYRILLKDTMLAMDSSYSQIGLTLQNWTHAKTFWITFNVDLQATASICSLKSIGTCPPLNIPNVKVSPLSCLSERITTWQKCFISCKEGSKALHSDITSTECLPTGVWKQIQHIRCAKSCPPLPAKTGTVFRPKSCTMLPSFHKEICEVFCGDGYDSGSKELSSVLVCNDGAWTGKNIVCTKECPSFLNIKHGSLIHTEEICKVSCDIGYKLENETFNLIEYYNTKKFNISCIEDSRDSLESQHSFASHHRMCIVFHRTNNSYWISTKQLCNNLFKNMHSHWKHEHLQQVSSEACPLLTLPKYNATHNMSLVLSNKKSVLTSEKCASFPQKIGQFCIFFCPSGYDLIEGLSIIECNSSRVWGSTIPRCVKHFFCPIIKRKNTHSIVYEPKYNGKAIVPGTVAYVTCNQGYKIRGYSEIICLSNGYWSSSTLTCSILCPPLPSKFLGQYNSSSCITDYFENGRSCQFSCKYGSNLRDGTKSSTLTCNNGFWSPLLPTCSFSNFQNNDHTVYELFYIMARKEKSLECIFVDHDNIVRFQSMEACKQDYQPMTWRWTNKQEILNLKTNKCLKPILHGRNYLLGVGVCEESGKQMFFCGNPKSSSYWSTLYYSRKEKWSLFFKNVGESLVYMFKASKNFQNVSFYAFSGISLVAQSKLEDNEEFDQPICSFLCGKKIMTPGSSNDGYISSPGFFTGQSYPPHLKCEWIFNAKSTNLTLALFELDLGSVVDSFNRCTADCLEIFEGKNDNLFYSEHIKTFFGNLSSLAHLDKDERIISTVDNSLFVRFMSDGKGTNTGFIFYFKFGNVPQLADECGTNLNGGPTVDDEKHLHGTDAVLGKWPWIVSIREGIAFEQKAYHRCTGVLLNEDTVLSAAHCAYFLLNLLEKGERAIFSPYIVSQVDVNEDLANGKFVTHDRIFLHPRFHLSARRHDIAIWKLSTPLYSDHLFLPCLPVYGYNVQNIYSPCYAVGWNNLYNGLVTNYQMEYRMKIVTSTYCEDLFGLGLDSGFICASHARLDKTWSSGTNDSEALMCHKLGRWFLVGVASHTRSTDNIALRLYTSVKHNAMWVKDVVNRLSKISYRSHGLEKFSTAYDYNRLLTDGDAWLKKHA